MVAPRFPYRVFELPAHAQGSPQGRIAPSRDLLPWADPYIAMLIQKLQEEVKEERSQQSTPWEARMRGEVPPPGGSEPLEFDFPDSVHQPREGDLPGAPR
ncbi:MAG: hypothetical protein WDZ59_07215 [Pirellulales bacterium]